MTVPVSVNEQGRPPIVHRNRRRAELIIEAVMNGETTTMAAQAGGISRRTLYEWKYKGQEVREARELSQSSKITPYDDDYLWFLTEYEIAETQRKRTLLSRIEKAGADPKRWQANAWLLQQLHPDEFSIKKTVQYQETRDKEVWTISMGQAPKQIPAVVEEASEPVTDYEIVE